MRHLGALCLMAGLVACGSPCDDIQPLNTNPTVGGVVYGNRCETCHGRDGTGTEKGPALTDRIALLDQCDVIEQVWGGGGDMPAFEDTLDPQEIADVTEYVFLEFDR